MGTGSKRSKIIFLDIDGVLNCNKTPNPHDLPYVVDKRLLRVFNRLVARTHAKVVLISDWRYDSAGLFSAREQGIKFEDAVPDWPKKSRGDEIRAWLRKHPDIVRFAVIDDDDDELDGLPLFQPSSASGITAKLSRGVASYLNEKTDKDMRSGIVTRTLENTRKRFKRLTK